MMNISRTIKIPHHIEDRDEVVRRSSFLSCVECYYCHRKRVRRWLRLLSELRTPNTFCSRLPIPSPTQKQGGLAILLTRWVIFSFRKYLSLFLQSFDHITFNSYHLSAEQLRRVLPRVSFEARLLFVKLCRIRS